MHHKISKFDFFNLPIDEKNLFRVNELNKNQSGLDTNKF